MKKTFLLGLDNNQLSGTLPTELGGMDLWHALMLNSNEFSGTIPTEYGLFQNLPVAFNLHDNPSLTGTIPTELGQLTDVYNFQIHNDNLSGSLPSELGNLSSLGLLLLANNSFTGTIPNEMNNLWMSLYHVNLAGNPSLSGMIPEALCNIEGTCVGFIDAPCELMNGLSFDCGTNGLCGCNCSCSSN